ncbi:eukaryotic aspartyl protease family protein [Artemisia annua]|uniref:Eukaryotic aspartyl protease family protein n=1 Tax=Artemisia annua TaxID=35608 RepID=A0A2U1N912_ARTAN|nr:eukaryotic aspartyl protease family protein [Artemisia annua]
MKTLALIFVLINISSSLAKPNHINGGFSLDLIDRDSPQSPLYNPAYSQFDRLKNAFQRSTSRAFHLSKRAGVTSNNASIDVNISAAFGEYLMLIKIGTPPVKVVGIVDTGSDLTWPNQVGPPILAPSNSSTYRALSCQSKGCKALDTEQLVQLPCDSSNKCRYDMGNGFVYTTGDLAVDNFWFGLTPVKNVVFGCGHDNEGSFEKDVSGIIGLGGGPGRMSFQLPLIKKDPSTFYYLTLESMLVGKHNVSAEPPLSKESGNMIIDWGTTLTYVPSEFYLDLIDTITKTVYPSVTFRFTGADVVVPPENLFLEIEKGVSCLALTFSEDGWPIFGNLSQRNMLVVYDLPSVMGLSLEQEVWSRRSTSSSDVELATTPDEARYSSLLETSSSA